MARLLSTTAIGKQITAINLKLITLALVSALLLSGCGAMGALFGTYTGNDKNKKKTNRELVTLGDIADEPVQFKRVKIRNVSAIDTIASYEAVLDYTDDPEMRFESTRRIADLSLISVEERLVQQADLADESDKIVADAQKDAEQAKTREAKAKARKKALEERAARDGDIWSEGRGKNKAKPKIISNTRRKAPDEKTVKAKKEEVIASNEPVKETEVVLTEQQKAKIASLEEEIAKLDEENIQTYKSAIALYEGLLKTQPNHKENDQVLYQLASAYDLSGDQLKTLDTLDLLTEKYPASPYYTEAQFRRGEIYFVLGDYITAAEAYSIVQLSKNDTRFNEHALYKHGWSLFKTNEYELAVNDFITLRDHLDAKVKQAKKQRRRYNSSSDDKLMTETNHVIALSFSHMAGPITLRDHFAKLGGRHYEYEIYKQLYSNYIHQERYRDAAETYDIFLVQYPTHRDAPKMQSAILQAYKDGGFPSLLLPGKIDYVKRFGINSDFWNLYVAENASQRVYSEDEREELRGIIKVHLADVSKHYHSVAQKSKKKKDFVVAATWYREYIDTFANKGGIDTAETLDIRKLLAESLYESEQYSLAVVEFETLSRASGNNKEEGANASYFALLSYQKMLESYSGEEEGKNALIAKKVESGNYFIENYREDKRMPNVLGNIVRDQLAVKDYAGAVVNARVLVSLDPPASKSMQKTAWVTIANAEFDAKDYANSEKSYQKILTYPGFTKKQRIKYHQQVANSIFKNAESLKEKGELIAAAEEFLRLGDVVPASRIRPKAHFDAANIYLQAKEWDKGIKTLNYFKRLYPKHKLIDTFPDKMAIAYKNTDQHDKAADQYLIIAGRYDKTNKELARQSYWEAATLREKGGNKKGTRDLYRDYANNFKVPLDQNVEAQYKLVQLYKEDNNTVRVNFWRDKILKTHIKAGDKTTPRITFLAAEISFENVETHFIRYRRIKLKQPLKRSLKAKKAAMSKVLKKYEDVSKMGSAEYTTASNHRIARIYQILGADLMASQRPKGLTQDQLDQYDILIEDQAIPFEDQAIEVFEHNADLVMENVYDKWVKASFKELAKLIPGRYAKFEKRDEYVTSIY